MKPMYGYHFLPIELDSENSKTVNLTIKKRKDYVTTQTDNSASFNLPVGYLSDTKNISSDITEKSIMLTYNYNDITNQVLSLNYSLSDTSLNYFNKIETGTDEGSCFIHYNINNSFTLPALKVPSTDYTLANYPYKIDQVRYFENDSISDKDYDTVFFSFYL